MRRYINRFLQLWLIFAVLAVSIIIFTFETFFDMDGWEVLSYRDMSYLSLPLAVYLLGFTLVLAMLFTIGFKIIESLNTPAPQKHSSSHMVTKITSGEFLIY